MSFSMRGRSALAKAATTIPRAEDKDKSQEPSGGRDVSSSSSVPLSNAMPAQTTDKTIEAKMNEMLVGQAVSSRGIPLGIGYGRGMLFRGGQNRGAAVNSTSALSGQNLNGGGSRQQSSVVAENPSWDDHTDNKKLDEVKDNPTSSDKGQIQSQRGGFAMGSRGGRGGTSSVVVNPARGSGFGSGFGRGMNNESQNLATGNSNDVGNRGGFSSAQRGNGRGVAAGPSRGRSGQAAGENRPYESGAQTQQIGNSNEKSGDNANADQKKKSTYVPPIRSVEAIVQEDVEQSKYYETIADGDEEVKPSFAGLSTQHQHVVAIDTWKDANFDEVLYNNIVEKSKYVRPRKIQARTIPLILEGRDLKGHAETGSGKTAAFILPIIHHVMKNKQPTSLMAKPAPFALIIEPTRELCLQVYEQGVKFANETGVGVKKAYGEFAVQSNRHELRAGDGCDILCATLGRLMHIVCDNWISLDKLKFLVLDEADRLMEEEFLDMIRRIIGIPGFPQKENRQTLMFSATFPGEILKLASEIMKEDSVMVSKEKLVSANNKIVQRFISVDTKKKKTILLEFLQNEFAKAKENEQDVPRYLVFVAKKKIADQIAIYLTTQGIKSTTINGDRTQDQRETALRSFTTKETPVLVSTDVCARGIDIKDLDHVINFDLPNFKGKNPKDPDDNTFDERPATYVQRIGRTGRLRPGDATSFFDELSDNDRDIASMLVGMMQDVGQVPPDFLVQTADDVTAKLNYVPPADLWGDENDDEPAVAATNVVQATPSLGDWDD